MINITFFDVLRSGLNKDSSLVTLSKRVELSSDGVELGLKSSGGSLPGSLMDQSLEQMGDSIVFLILKTRSRLNPHSNLKNIHNRKLKKTTYGGSSSSVVLGNNTESVLQSCHLGLWGVGKNILD